MRIRVRQPHGSPYLGVAQRFWSFLPLGGVMADPITRRAAAHEGCYRIGRQLGEGGMARVFRADDLKHERKVALSHLPLFDERAS